MEKILEFLFLLKLLIDALNAIQKSEKSEKIH